MTSGNFDQASGIFFKFQVIIFSKWHKVSRMKNLDDSFLLNFVILCHPDNIKAFLYVHSVHARTPQLTVLVVFVTFSTVVISLLFSQCLVRFMMILLLMVLTSSYTL
jgi:hypothetical protein